MDCATCRSCDGVTPRIATSHHAAYPFSSSCARVTPPHDGSQAKLRGSQLKGRARRHPPRSQAVEHPHRPHDGGQRSVSQRERFVVVASEGITYIDRRIEAAPAAKVRKRSPDGTSRKRRVSETRSNSTDSAAVRNRTKCAAASAASRNWVDFRGVREKVRVNEQRSRRRSRSRPRQRFSRTVTRLPKWSFRLHTLFQNRRLGESHLQVLQQVLDLFRGQDNGPASTLNDDRPVIQHANRRVFRHMPAPR
jgi:hypothetical protein